ncbi:MAG: PQQ-dependent sugar dehydrogenase [Gemmatimonadetes bacterium]|nr:PQQ-dependent sugar dehydrogenase [Gemmatimonadota bacterium]
MVAALSAFVSYQPQPQQTQKPDESRFTRVELVPAGVLKEPMNVVVLPDSRVLIGERKGAIQMYDPVTKTTKTVNQIAVNHTLYNPSGRTTAAEEGLIGMSLDPNFQQNRWLWLIFAHPTIAKHTLARYVVDGDSLFTRSEKVVFEWDFQRETCCHTGGGMTWDRDGNLYITTGNNRGNAPGRKSQTDERPGRVYWDDQGGAANTNSHTGKILRIHPEPDGSYTIPPGNMFAPGTPNTLPEIYTMGHRNPWRPTIDSRTGILYWGEIGSDAGEASDSTVEGYDEFNQARGPGFFGWPYFIGPNRAYPITDYIRGRILPPKDPARPINESRWNNGLRELPPAQPAFIGYPYAASEEYPEVGSGGRCAVGGPFYHRADFKPNAARPWPAYYEGKWITADCARNWIMAITLDDNSNYRSMERFMPTYSPVIPLDIEFGPEGDLYVLEYGSLWWGEGPDSRLVRIEYNAGNREPDVEISSNTTGGRVPFAVTLSSAGTRDPDDDALRYEWRVTPASGGAARIFTTANPEVNFDRPGVYDATLTVRDPAGATASKSLRIVAGNSPPTVALKVAGGNQSFFFPGRSIQYAAQVSDPEDGTVDPQRVAVSIDYVPAKFDAAALRHGDRPVDATTRFAVAQALMGQSDCRSCHTASPPRSLGPSFTEIATRYQGDNAAVARLVTKIRNGGSGAWGEVAMPAHPATSVAEATAMARYILASNSTSVAGRALSGSYTPEIPEGDDGHGSVIIRAVYSDRGANGFPNQTGERMLVLRSPTVIAGSAEIVENTLIEASNRGGGPLAARPRPNGHIGFRQLDLTGITSLDLTASLNPRYGETGGTIEVRLGSPTGQLLGQTELAPGPQPAMGQPVPAPVPRRVTLTAMSGRHDLYFVFRNPAAKPISPLMTLATIRFNQ